MERYVFAIKNIFLKLKRLCFRICSNLYFFKTKYKTHMNITDGINITEGTMKGSVFNVSRITGTWSTFVTQLKSYNI